MTKLFDISSVITPRRHRPRCGARCRSKGGEPCIAPAVWDKENDKPRNGRCRNHGGLSTGPKTPEGRLKSLSKLKQYQVTKEENDTNLRP